MPSKPSRPSGRNAWHQRNVIAAQRAGLTDVVEPLWRRPPLVVRLGLIAQFIDRRHLLALTQADVNARIGCADGLVSKWECGDRTPSGFMLWCWARALKASMMLMPDETS